MPAFFLSKGSCTPPSTMLLPLLLQVVDMAKHPNYLHRMAVLYCLRDLCKAVSPSDAATVVVPVCLHAASDPVPNIRFVAAKILQDLQPILAEAQVEKEVVPCLRKLTEDVDVDVRYYSECSLQAFRPQDAVA
jgi:serine/threonine-protein phosphatase 2A regulatory subunit A